MRTCARLGALLAVAAVLLLNSAETGASPGTTTRASVSSAGVQGNDESHDAAISPNGRYVAFDSRASNLVSDDTAVCGTVSCSDVFVRDRQTGVTERVSLSSGGVQGTGDSQSPAISADGRFVAFQSFAPNLVPGDTPACQVPGSSPPVMYNCPDIFVRDRQTSTTTRINLSSGGAEANGESWAPAITASGRFVAFQSFASNLVSGDTNVCGSPPATYSCADVFVRDRDTDADGIFDEPGAVSTIRVSLSTSGVEGNGDSGGSLAISADGRYVAFVSDASNLVSGDTNNFADGFVRDRQTSTTTRVSLSSGGAQANNNSYEVSISSDGRYVAFSSDASNLVSGDANGFRDIFVRDRDTDADGVFDEPGAVSTTRMSVNSSGGQANAASYYPAISGDGTYVAFESPATNLVPGDTNGVADVFVRTRATGGMALVSVDSWEGQGNGESSLPAINGDGRYVAFESLATNLVLNDSNDVADVFVHDRFWPAGGIAELPDVALAPAGQTGVSAQTRAALAGAAAAALALAVAAWCARRRFGRLWRD